MNAPLCLVLHAAVGILLHVDLPRYLHVGTCSLMSSLEVLDLEVDLNDTMNNYAGPGADSI